ncbi:hypothetical protein NLJ89_g1195 [Agrocybe chaxingu]|uniref:Uncharacterized protein n=1 Tax=Agrocybe chaxingu TaxID=84603 RepID=A0A9W8TFM1_9AGAR|nr:hypothetical protein NLJ89_g1195 [Agrocybe chaxingu]
MFASLKNMSKKVIIEAATVSLCLANKLAPKHTVTSVIRIRAQERVIKEASATPILLLLEDASIEDFTRAFTGDYTVFLSRSRRQGRPGEDKEG